jgi:diguanylate cyclase (GGDEF)-like protein
MYEPLVKRLNDWLLSTDRKQRLRMTRSLMAANVFVACIFLQMYACWMGYMEVADVKRLSGAILANVLLWYGVLRSGLNLRFADPALTLPQILSALTIIVGAYSVTGPAHGATMMLLALVLVFGIFNMRPRGAKIAGAYTVVLMGITMLIKIRTDPVYYPLKLEVAHFVLTASIVPTISSLAAQLSSLRAKLQAQKDELANALVRIQILATRDELTGLLNRRHMMEVLNQHSKRLQRSGHHRFCLALLDIDHFKRINDTHGHGVGDEVLRQFSQIVQSGLRDTDVLARWGGEEFLVLLNDTTPELANVGLARARTLLAQATLVAGLPELRPTFSAGLTCYLDDEPLDVCIERADRALYRAKNTGRNRTVMVNGPLKANGQIDTQSASLDDECALRG